MLFPAQKNVMEAVEKTLVKEVWDQGIEYAEHAVPYLVKRVEKFVTHKHSGALKKEIVQNVLEKVYGHVEHHISDMIDEVASQKKCKCTIL